MPHDVEGTSGEGWAKGAAQKISARSFPMGPKKAPAPPAIHQHNGWEDNMEPIKLTKHAERRANQRGIRRNVIETMIEFGKSKISGGCEVIYMDQTARAHLRNCIGKTSYAKIERALDKILVLSEDGHLVTCCHRNRSVRAMSNGGH